MNLREGKIGRQEAAAAAAVVCIMSGIFSVNTESFYKDGNSSYFSTMLSALLSILLMLLVSAVMKKRRICHLAGLYHAAYGPVLTIPVSLCTSILLLYAAAAPVIRMLTVLSRYVYLETPAQNVSLYFLVCILILALAGLETIGRTSKIFFLVVILSIVTTFVVASPAFSGYRLFPLLGNGMPAALKLGVTGIPHFSALLALLICGSGVHGPENAASGGVVGAGIGGVVAAGAQLCLGLIYPAGMLAGMHAPMYRATMALRSSVAYLRVDKLLLFFWVLGSLIGAGFCTYAAALLYVKSTDMRDIRPVVWIFALIVGSISLLGIQSPFWFEQAALFLQSYGWLLLILPPLLSAGICAMGRERL